MIETFGQPLPSARHLHPLAREISSHINNGRPSPWAGFVWHRPAPALFTDRELGHLQFIRWLYQTGFFDEATCTECEVRPNDSLPGRPELHTVGTGDRRFR